MASALMTSSPQIDTTPWMRPLPASARLILFGDSAAQRAAAEVLALPYSTSACRAVTDGARAALWLGPDERLLLAPQAELATVINALTTTLAGHAHSLVDISQRQIAFELHGPHASSLLNAQCALDLALDSFPVGMCTRTVFAKAEIVLWRTAADCFHVEVWRSFADYLLTLLREVSHELPG
jgi:sarcosine oxidase subunit gamma